MKPIYKAHWEAHQDICIPLISGLLENGKWVDYGALVDDDGYAISLHIAFSNEESDYASFKLDEFDVNQPHFSYLIAGYFYATKYNSNHGGK
jgi:hypothetical protein